VRARRGVPVDRPQVAAGRAVADDVVADAEPDPVGDDLATDRARPGTGVTGRAP
jgi:hypothetical protein